MGEIIKSVSVIIPIYNGSKKIARCLKSVLSQSYIHYDVIIINDGSTDDSEHIIKQIIQTENKNQIPIKYIKQKNKGVAYTRNRGICIAKGDYLAFIDQDDYIECDYLKDYMEAVNEGAYDIVIGGFLRVTEAGKLILKMQLTDDKLSKFIIQQPWAHVYKKAFVLEHNLSFLEGSIGEDVYFNVMAYSRTNAIKILKTSKYMWTDNPNSFSNQHQRSINKISDPLYLLSEIHKNIPETNCIGKQDLEYFFIGYIVWYLTFTVKNSSIKDIEMMYSKLFNWLSAKYPNYFDNPNIKLSAIKRGHKGIKLGIFIFMLGVKMGLTLPILKRTSRSNVKRCKS